MHRTSVSLSFFLVLTYRENLCHKLYNTMAGLCAYVCFLMVHSRLIYALKTQACEDLLFSRHSELAGPINSATGCETLPSSWVRQTHHSTQTQPRIQQGKELNLCSETRVLLTSFSQAVSAPCMIGKNMHEEGVSVACHLDADCGSIVIYSMVPKVFFAFMYHDIYMIL